MESVYQKDESKIFDTKKENSMSTWITVKYQKTSSRHVKRN